MRRSSLHTGIYVLLVFLSGGAVGAFAHRLYVMNSVRAAAPSKSPEEYRRKYVAELRGRLSLSSDQVSQLVQILDSTKQQYHEAKVKREREVREKSAPDLKAIHDDQVLKISAMLDDRQRIEYRKFHEDREKRRRQKKKPLDEAAKPPLSIK